jgi:hypothetical protein
MWVLPIGELSSEGADAVGQVEELASLDRCGVGAVAGASCFLDDRVCDLDHLGPCLGGGEKLVSPAGGHPGILRENRKGADLFRTDFIHSASGHDCKEMIVQKSSIVKA